MQRKALIIHYYARERLRMLTNILIQREMNQGTRWEFDLMRERIEDAAKDISETFFRDLAPYLSEQDTTLERIGFDLEVLRFYEHIFDQLLSAFPIGTEEVNQQETTIQQLQSVSDAIRQFCSIHVKEGNPTKDLGAELDESGAGIKPDRAATEIDTVVEEADAAAAEAFLLVLIDAVAATAEVPLVDEGYADAAPQEPSVDEVDADEAPLDPWMEEGYADAATATPWVDEGDADAATAEPWVEEGDAGTATAELDSQLESTETEKEHDSLEVKAEVLVRRANFSKETEEQEGSDMADVEGEAVVGRGKIEAGMGGDKNPTETEEAPWVDSSDTEMEEESFAAFRRGWEREWGNGKGKTFENLSLLSSMMFTHCTPGCSPIGAVIGRTFQVYSVKIAEIKGLQWPLKVYGVVAARDDVDKNRIPLFLRPRDDYQVLCEQDPFLQLTGPCRAIVLEEPVEIEIQLSVNRGKKTDDRPLISEVFYYNGDKARLFGSSANIENHLCKIELSFQQLNQSVQATFLGFHVGEPSPFECGVRVVCSTGSFEDGIEPKHRQIVLFDSRSMAMAKCGYLSLSRQVVSVELQGRLEVLVQAYAPSGDIAANGKIFITPEQCHTTQHKCQVGDSELKFTIAWSLLLADKTLMLMNGYVDPFEDLPPFHPSLLEKLGISE